MQFKDILTQITVLTVASMKSRYRKTWAGFLWVILNPIMMFGVQGLVFRKFLKIEVPDYFLFLLGGLLPWIFFTSTVQMGTPVFVNQAQLLRSFKINPWVVLGSQVLDNFLNFMATFLVVMLPFYLMSDKSLFHLLLLPVAFFPLLVATLSITVSLSILNVFYRDINFVMGFIFNILFFLTPVFYPKSFVPEQFQWMVEYNPINFFIDPFRNIIHTNNLEGLLPSLVLSLGAAVVFMLLALMIWKKKQNDFYRKL
jgi:lipopolysaccharide transport system permease protein